MRNLIIAGIFVILIGLCSVSMAAVDLPSDYKTYETEHFTIYSPLDPRLVKYIEKNADAYYKNMASKFFADAPQLPFEYKLKIYYSATQSDTERLLRREKVSQCDLSYGIYISGLSAIFTHRTMNDGSDTGWGTLFHEITHYFISLNFIDPPDWFEEELAMLLGERTRVVKGNITIGRPNPWREQKLRDGIERKKTKIDIKYMLSLSDKKFDRWDYSRHVARSFFYYLYEKRKLNDYIKLVKKEGYTLEVLEKAVGMSSEEINEEWLAFIKKRCYPAAYFLDSKDFDYASVENKDLLKKALGIDPNYEQAQLELAKTFMGIKAKAKPGIDQEELNKRFMKMARETLQYVLCNPQSQNLWEANRIIALTYFREGDFKTAIDYYHQALEYGEYNESQYLIYYRIGSCYRELGDKTQARQWFQKFLDENWEPDFVPALVKKAKEYLAQEG